MYSRDSTKDLLAQRKELLQEVDKLKAENHDIIKENVKLIEKLKIESFSNTKAPKRGKT